MRVAILLLGLLVIASVSLQVESTRSDQIRYELIQDIIARIQVGGDPRARPQPVQPAVFRLDNNAYLQNGRPNPQYLWTTDLLPTPPPDLLDGEQRITAAMWTGMPGYAWWNSVGRRWMNFLIPPGQLTHGWPNNHGSGDAEGRIVWGTTEANWRFTDNLPAISQDLLAITMHIPNRLIDQAENWAQTNQWPTRNRFVSADPYRNGQELTIIQNDRVPRAGRTIRLREVQAAFPGNPNDPRIAVGQRVYFHVHYTVPQMTNNRNNDPTHLTVNLRLP